MEKRIMIALLLICLYATSQAQSGCATAKLHYPDSLVCSDVSVVQPDSLFPALPLGAFVKPYGLAMDTASGQIFPSVSFPGRYLVKYVALDSCSDTASFSIRIAQSASAIFSYSPSSICTDGANSIPVITGDSGGVFSWSGSGVLDVDSLSGAIHPATSDTGIYTVTYSVTGDCPASVNFLITVNVRPVPDFVYPDTAFCGNSPTVNPVLLGSTGGRFRAFPAVLALDSLSGRFNPQASNPGLYQIVQDFFGSLPCC